MADVTPFPEIEHSKTDPDPLPDTDPGTDPVHSR
jgi:hypothetical protein